MFQMICVKTENHLDVIWLSMLFTCTPTNFLGGFFYCKLDDLTCSLSKSVSWKSKHTRDISTFAVEHFTHENSFEQTKTKLDVQLRKRPF